MVGAVAARSWGRIVTGDAISGMFLGGHTGAEGGTCMAPGKRMHSVITACLKNESLSPPSPGPPGEVPSLRGGGGLGSRAFRIVVCGLGKPPPTLGCAQAHLPRMTGGGWGTCEADGALLNYRHDGSDPVQTSHQSHGKSKVSGQITPCIPVTRGNPALGQSQRQTTRRPEVSKTGATGELHRRFLLPRGETRHRG